MYKIAGTGSYLPSKTLTNDDLSKFVETSDSWIQERTGIKQRHFVENELTSDLACKAAENALKDAGITAEQLDLIIVATTTPDYTFPSTAVIVQDKLGAVNAASFDVQAVCSGFVYGLSVAEGYFATKKAKHALVIGAESLSKLLDFEDRTTCVLFGDGAGAVVLSEKDDETSGLISTKISSMGQFVDLLKTTGGPGLTQSAGFITMQGQEVFRHAVSNLKKVCLDMLAENNLEKSDIDLLIPHQANKRIIDSTAKSLSLKPEQVVVTVDQHANTSAASIPLALDWANKQGKIKKGDTLLLEAFGAGFTFGGALIKW
ncbi:MAG: 3-oxoacyl-[acyl-carrier-protein] synthase 3 protein 1 [Proteobacteria bacterium]|nr:MAG: 3-oxoacyl-[acyl-carrier-protein] synthase 3 protein 1 [Pseudomonadota bacterium]